MVFSISNKKSGISTKYTTTKNCSIVLGFGHSLFISLLISSVYTCRNYWRFFILMTKLTYSKNINCKLQFQVTKAKPACCATLRRLDLNIRFVTTALDSRHALQNMMTVRKITLLIFLKTFLLFQENKLCYEAVPQSARCSTFSVRVI